MIKTLSTFAVKYPVTITMLVLATVLLGYISFRKLGVELFPELNNPRLFIEIKAGERPPEEIEELLVNRIEALVISQSGVIQVSSSSRVGVAQIKVEYSWNKDMDEAFLDLSKALSSFGQDQDIEELNIMQYDPNSEPVMVIALQYDGEGDLNDLRKVAENYIRNDLIRLEGVAAVEIEGKESQEVIVETNEYLIRSYGVNLNTIASRIRSFNQNISGGAVTEMGRRYVVKGISELKDITDLEDIIIAMQTVTAGTSTRRVPVLLRDVAKVYFGSKEMENMVFLNGDPCIGMSIYKETKYNTVKAVQELRASITRLEDALPGYRFTIIQDQGKFISASIGEVSNGALLGMLLAVFVLFFFLRRIEPTFIVSTAIPISILACFTLMYFQNLSLNVMTLGGLALGAGMLVDNAIVVIENIFRNHEEGKTKNEASIVGTSQVGGAIIASTLTTIVVFLPIVYLHGASGELFKEQALTVTYSLLCSLLVAIVVIPMLYSVFYKRKININKEEVKESVRFTAYGRFLSRILEYRGWVIFIGILMLAAGWLMMKSLGSEFMPRTQSGEFYVDVRLPEGTRLERTHGAITSIEYSIKELGGEMIDNIYSQVGPSSGLSVNQSSLFQDQNMATIKVSLNSDSSHADPSFIMEDLTRLYQDVPDLKLSCRQEETALQSILGTDESPVVIEISGEDMEILEDISIRVINEIQNIPELVNISSSVEGGAPEVEIFIDRYRAGLMNLNVNEIVSAVSQKLEGVNSGQMEVGGEYNDITLKLDRIGLYELGKMILDIGGMEVSMNEIAEISIGSSPKEILHNNQNRVIRLNADISGKIPLDQLSDMIRENLTGIDFPTGYKYDITGQEEQRKESMRNLSFALILSLVLVYMVLASQFESLIHPFTILLTVPLALVGAFAIFYILGRPLNIMAYIGIIMLGGIAVNNSIILIDAIIQLRREGSELKDAIVTGGMRRIRPIIMTSLTTILALIPLTLGFGESSALRSPLAFAVIGGLVTSTILTLIVIPCVYMSFSLIGKRKTNIPLNKKD